MYVPITEFIKIIHLLLLNDIQYTLDYFFHFRGFSVLILSTHNMKIYENISSEI